MNSKFGQPPCFGSIAPAGVYDPRALGQLGYGDLAPTHRSPAYYNGVQRTGAAYAGISPRGQFPGYGGEEPSVPGEGTKGRDDYSQYASPEMKEATHSVIEWFMGLFKPSDPVAEDNQIIQASSAPAPSTSIGLGPASRHAGFTSIHSASASQHGAAQQPKQYAVQRKNSIAVYALPVVALVGLYFVMKK